MPRRIARAGLLPGVAGNQTERAGRFLRELNLPVDVLATSDDWGVTKPDSGFFHKLVAVSGRSPDEIVYVGDRLDNDITPAAEAGLCTAFVRRGPWGHVLPEGNYPWPDVAIDTLAFLPGALCAL